jgi:hypothetical protein
MVAAVIDWTALPSAAIVASHLLGRQRGGTNSLALLTPSAQATPSSDFRALAASRLSETATIR